jgi:hypothetical protein
VWEVSGVQGVNDIFVTIQDDKDGGFWHTLCFFALMSVVEMMSVLNSDVFGEGVRNNSVKC